MIQNQAGAELAPLGNFCDTAGCQVTSTPSLELFYQRVQILELEKSSQPRVQRCSDVRWCFSKCPNVPDWHPVVSVT